MKRVSIVTLSLLLPLVAFAAPACSSEADPDPGGSAGTGTTTAGTGTTSAGTGTTTAGTGTGGTGSSTGGTTGTAGVGTGGSAAGTTSTGGTGTAGTGTGGSGTAGAGTAGAGTAGSAGSGSGSCPAKIDSKVMCTAAITCNDAYCGVFKLGSKDCTCAAAAGFFDCSSCDYTGKTEEIVLPPASPLAVCTADDMTLEDTTGCTKGERCRSTDAAKVRFCACWDDPVAGGTVWDCDAMPSAWPK